MWNCQQRGNTDCVPWSIWPNTVKILRFPSQVLQDVRIFQNDIWNNWCRSWKSRTCQEHPRCKWWICLSKGSKRYFCRRCASCTGRESWTSRMRRTWSGRRMQRRGQLCDKVCVKRINDSINQTVDEIWLNQLVTESKCLGHTDNHLDYTKCKNWKESLSTIICEQ